MQSSVVNIEVEFHFLSKAEGVYVLSDFAFQGFVFSAGNDIGEPCIVLDVGSIPFNRGRRINMNKLPGFLVKLEVVNNKVVIIRGVYRIGTGNIILGKTDIAISIHKIKFQIDGG